MYVPLGIKSDYSLLQSLVKIDDLVKLLKKHNITAVGIIDDHLFGTMDFYTKCIKEGIKPIIGLDVLINNHHLYLYARNLEGYKSLLKINTIIQTRELAMSDLLEYNYQVLAILPYLSIELYDNLASIYEYLFVGYSSSYEKNNALIVTGNIVYVNEVKSLSESDTKYLDYLQAIDEGSSLKDITPGNYERNYFLIPDEIEDVKTTQLVGDLLNVEMDFTKRYIPKYMEEGSYEYLVSLAKKGLLKRLNNKLKSNYVNRLLYELEVIKKMGFVDYFLIVYDYVKYAKTHDVLVGPGRGSAAGSLVSYCLGITNVDPLEYNLLFERFLNPDRITMPDIDIDFEFSKREEVINYVKGKYGREKVAAIMTYGTLASKQVIRDVGKSLDVDGEVIDYLAKAIDAKLSLGDNAKNSRIKQILLKNSNLQKVYKVGMKLEGLKRHVSTHAAGIVISSVILDEVIPIYVSNEMVLTGFTMEYLENLGLLKMDFLALRNLTIIKNVLDLIKEYTGRDLNLNEIPLDDAATLNLLKTVDTDGVFQFESVGMKSFLRKLKISSFNDVIAAIALFRPGPMENIDTFIARKEGRVSITYPDPSLESFLSDTYGVMIYQEQIMQVLVSMASYSFAEADNIRRAMSKKKYEVMEENRQIFVSRAIDNGYDESVAIRIYDLIIKFANYGFNKAHSVCYALIGYQMAYLKCHYKEYFMINLLNMSIGSEIKTKEYFNEAKRSGLLFQKPDINLSKKDYYMIDKYVVMPITVIKNVGVSVASAIEEERNKNGVYSDYLNFVMRGHQLGIGRKILESLIRAGALDSFNIGRNTMLQNMESAFNYADLCADLDESLVLKPVLSEKEELDLNTKMSDEARAFGFYITNHPASKYNGDDIVKADCLEKYFDKYVKMVVLINNIKVVKTKRNEEMAFVSASDEVGTINFIIFPKKNGLIRMLRNDKLYVIYGQVTRREYDYQVVVSNILEV